MWITSKMGIRTPSEWEDPFWASDVFRMTDLDDQIFANFEDKNSILLGDVAFDPATGQASWAAALHLVSSTQNGMIEIAADTITVNDGEFLYVVVPRPYDTGALVATAGSPPFTDIDIVPIAYRDGANLYLRGRGRNVPVATGLQDQYESVNTIGTTVAGGKLTFSAILEDIEILAAGHKVSIAGSAGGVELFGGTVSGDVTISGRAGGVNITGDAGGLTIDSGASMTMVAGGALVDWDFTGPTEIDFNAPATFGNIAPVDWDIDSTLDFNIISAPMGINVGGPPLNILSTSGVGGVSFNYGGPAVGLIEAHNVNQFNVSTSGAGGIANFSTAPGQQMNFSAGGAMNLGAGAGMTVSVTGDFSLSGNGGLSFSSTGTSPKSFQISAATLPATFTLSSLSATTTNGFSFLTTGTDAFRLGTTGIGWQLSGHSNPSSLLSDNGMITIQTTGTVPLPIWIVSVADSKLSSQLQNLITSAQNAADAVLIQATHANGGIEIESLLGGLNFNTTGSALLESTKAATANAATMRATGAGSSALVQAHGTAKLESTNGEVTLDDSRGSANLTDVANPALLTTNQTIFGAINEINSAIPVVNRQAAYDYGAQCIVSAAGPHDTRLLDDDEPWEITDDAGNPIFIAQMVSTNVIASINADTLNIASNGLGVVDMTGASFSFATSYGNLTVHNSDLGVEIASPNRVALSAPRIELDADKDGALYGDITATAEGDISLAAKETFEASSGTGAGVIAGDASGYLTHQQPHITTATRLGDRFMAVDDSSTDDSTVTMSATDCRDVLMKGTAINRWHVLPDATSLVAGTVVMVFRNWSSEIRGVRNSDSTLWLRIMPSQTAVVFLTEGGTAAGVWGAELSTINRDYGFHLTEDFITGAPTTPGQTQNGLYMAASGTGATSRAVGTSSTHGANAIGVGELYSGTDTDSEAYFTFYSSAINAGFSMALGCYAERVRLALASDGTNTYVARFGFGDSVTSTSHTDGAWFEYDSTASAKWLMCVAGGATETKTATSIADIAFNPTLYDLAVEIASDASRADFWIDKVHVGSIADANVPQVTETFGMVHILANVAGTANNRKCTMDRTAIMGAMPTRRA